MKALPDMTEAYRRAPYRRALPYAMARGAVLNFNGGAPEWMVWYCLLMELFYAEEGAELPCAVYGGGAR